MSTCTIELDPKADPANARAIWDGLLAYNLQHAPPDNHQDLVMVLRDEKGKLVGGLVGDTYWGWLYVRILWLEEAVRGQDYGSQLLKAAEEEAVHRGCKHSHLDTMSFQALPFYQKHGYTIYGVLEDQPEGCQRYYLRKDL